MIELELKQIAEKKTAQIIKKELDTKKYEETAWLKAFKKANGNEEQARALYVDIREEKLFEEVYAKLKEDLDAKVTKDKTFRNQRNIVRDISDILKKPIELPLSEYEKQQLQNKHLKNIKTGTSETPFFIRFFNGDLPLVISYWLITIVIPAIIYVIAIAINEENNPVLLLMLFAYYVFAFIGTWKSAGNYINKNSPPFWGYATRVVIVLSIVSFVVGILSNSK
jgi:hypothetical protein